MTTVNGIAVLLGVFFLNGFIARQYGLEVLGEFLLVRRTAFAMMGILLIGMSIGLPSLIGRSKESKIEGSAFVIFVMFTLPIVGFITYIISLGYISGFNMNHSLAYGIFLIGASLQYMTYGVYRGYMKMIGANSIQIIGTALIPIAVFIFVGDLSRSLSIIGMSLILLNAFAFFLHTSGKINLIIKWQTIRKIIRFGAERLISFVSQFILLAGAPLLVSAYSPYTDLAYFNSLISLVRLLLFVVGPLGVVLLPRIAKAVRENNESQIAQGLTVLMKITLFFGGLIAVFLSSTGGIILELWLGSISETGVWMASVLLFTIPFYMIVEIMRSPIDGLSLRGYNSIIYLIAAMALIGSFYLLTYFNISELHAGVYCFLIGYITAAIGSIIVIKKLTNIFLPNIQFFVTIILVFAGFYTSNMIINHIFLSISIQFILKLALLLLFCGLAFFQTKGLIQELNQLSKEL
ncbi:MAG: hypothetical protein H8E71_06750 [Candidatus Marinimicrobia bacterium]|nr:hypothetical protein [Candidatus Neomarinimicrobiota bacterium]MBL7110221.1 hypothetical protein [Candidatus Neomarinimicrobiota bacterium]